MLATAQTILGQTLLGDASMKATALILSTAALIALSACSKQAQTDQDVGQTMDANALAERVDALKLAPGEWEATTEVLDVNVEGLPPGVPADAMTRMIGQRTTFKHCITPAQAEKPSADFLAGQKDANCSIKKFDMTKGNVTADMNCAVPQQQNANMNIRMEGTYLPESYDMDMNVLTEGMSNGLTMTMKMKNSGKRIGDCPADQSGAKSGPDEIAP